MFFSLFHTFSQFSLLLLQAFNFLGLSGYLCTLIEISTETKEMGLSLQNSSTNSKNPSTVAVNQCCDTTDYVFNLKPSLKRMFLDLGLSCFTLKGSGNDEKEHKSGNLEHNKAWLLAESGAELSNGDPHSVHSSFRFSFCSPNEVGSMTMNNNNTAATVLIVNLDNGLLEDDDDSCAQAQQLRWQRIESLEKSISPLTSALIRFSFADIISATRNFRKGRVLGRGALSYVFRGRVGLLRTSVAIKRLDRADKESPKAFCRELMIASSLSHQNIVPLVGFCIDAEEGFFLVYKYVSGGSLESHLHDKKQGKKFRSPLSMSMRYKVAVGIGEAIAYLHNGIERCVVHRDIKPSNILLSSKNEPKLCDFGLATWTPAPSVPFLCKTVKGTFGYLAPEYFQHGKVSDKTDVYAFGVVLLELLTGRKPIEAKRPPGEENLVLWAKPLLQKGVRAMEELLDPRLKCNIRRSRQVARMMQAAAACINTEESQRPGIDEILPILRGEEEVFSSKKRSNFSGSGCVVDYYTHLQQTNSEVNNHLALALRGISELEDDDYFYYQ